MTKLEAIKKAGSILDGAGIEADLRAPLLAILLRELNKPDADIGSRLYYWKFIIVKHPPTEPFSMKVRERKKVTPPAKEAKKTSPKREGVRPKKLPKTAQPSDIDMEIPLV